MRWAALCLLMAVACREQRDTWVLSAGALEPLAPMPVAPPEQLEPLAPEARGEPTRRTGDDSQPILMELRPQAEVMPVTNAADVDPAVFEPLIFEQVAAATESELPAIVEPEPEPVPGEAAMTAQEATEREGAAQPTWLQQYRVAYAERQVARGDVTAAISDPRLGVYIEDHRALGEQLDTPHMRWLGGGDVQVVSPSIEALMVGRNAELFGRTANFTCDASRYVCRSTAASPVGVYYRFAALGEARAVRLVGVMYFDPSASQASIGRNIVAFDQVIDRELDLVE